MNNGSFNTNAYNNRYLRFEWWINNQDIAGNYTDIGWKVYGAGGSSTWYKTGPIYVSINGSNVHTTSGRINLANGTQVASGTYRLYHNNEGDCSFSAGISAAIYSSSINCNGSGNWSLPRIARYCTIINADNFTDEQNPTMTFSNPSGQFGVRCKIEAGGNSQLIIRDLANNATSCTFNLTDDERNTLRSLAVNSNSLSVLFTVCSMNGNTELSFSYLNRTMTIVNGNPTFSNFTYKDINTTVTNVIGTDQALVKGVSTLQATVSSDNKMVTQKNATPKNYVATIDDINMSKDYSTSDIVFDLGKIKTVGTKRLNIRAYDSRNNSTLVYKDITVYDYEAPVLNITSTRLNNFEDQTTLTIEGSFSSLKINDVEKNALQSVKYRYREASGEWNDYVELTPTVDGNKFTCQDVILSLDNTNAYEFEVVATDKLSSTTRNSSVDVGQSIFMISSNKKAVYINGQEVLMYDVVDEW